MSSRPELGGELELRDGAVVEREAAALERGVLDAADGELPVEVLAVPGAEFGERLVALRVSRAPLPASR